jgi:hypothetical protein
VLAPDVALSLSKVKQLNTGSNVGLFDANGVVGGLTTAGVPVIISTDVSCPNTWVLDGSQGCVAAQRNSVGEVR